MVKGAHQKIQNLKNSGKTHHEAWNLTSVDLVEMTKVGFTSFIPHRTIG